MRRYNHEQAINPFCDKPAVCEGEHGWRIDEHIIVMLPCFLQECSEAR
jgi:hypothetical protein